MNWWLGFSLCRRRKNSDEFDCDQRKEHEQVNSQRPQGYLHRAGHLYAWHIQLRLLCQCPLFRGRDARARDESLHNIAITNDTDQAVVSIHDRDHVKLIPGEKLG